MSWSQWCEVIGDCSLSQWLITGFVTTVTRREPHVEQELSTWVHPVFSDVHIARSLIFYVMCLSFCPFSCWSLCCLVIRFTVLITPLISSNFSCWCWSNCHSDNHFLNFIFINLLLLIWNEENLKEINKKKESITTQKIRRTVISLRWIKINAWQL